MTHACSFCRAVIADRAAHFVLEDEATVAFLDRRPLFPGHVLLIPRLHVETVADLPPELLQPFFENLQSLSIAVRKALACDGIFIANNNLVSQSVPHLHFHVVPRRRGDGLRGFFWPRHPYREEETARAIAEGISTELSLLRGKTH